MVRIKICGITRLEDALFSLESGADAVGFVFAEGSKRRITPEHCSEIMKKLPIFSYTVGVFKNNTKEFILDTLLQCGFSAIQFHGNEDEEFCHSFHRPVLKAFSVENEKDIDYVNSFTQTGNVLIDGKEPGSGQVFNHDVLQKVDKAKNVILAGGLNPDNVFEIISKYAVFGVDVSTGVEQAPGLKDKNKIIKFIEQVRRVK